MKGRYEQHVLYAVSAQTRCPQTSDLGPRTSDLSKRLSDSGTKV